MSNQSQNDNHSHSFKSVALGLLGGVVGAAAFVGGLLYLLNRDWK